MTDVAGRIAQRALAKRGASYAGEVRRLLDAALEIMRQRGTASRPRVADIVSAAGLSNEAFYRHFPSKDALVAALLEDGTERLHSYVAHRMSKQDTARDRVRAWVEGVLSQASEDIAATTRAVLWNGREITAQPPTAGERLARLLHEPFAELGSADPGFDAALAAHATFGRLAECLWRSVEPGAADVDRVTAFCLRAITSDAS
ncbi:TetR/AcrR family transcriptional regulator [Amycolatopsis sp. K13G38]|uniref:TetR/AcrR family transcriptional regulator n=1 Tax=Amycolatopsis acididurans TaxID=2724524 RepID=A0ABX1IVN5_9PSEU|nr:TetR/AcrR family transcriptional regulator [Amycolatopsis acididurans]NKQ51531.1 TetR/AcrR family transcriptional regulator [Amycolatopsis acididurans]